jgi:hypothetical protein
MYSLVEGEFIYNQTKLRKKTQNAKKLQQKTLLSLFLSIFLTKEKSSGFLFDSFFFASIQHSSTQINNQIRLGLSECEQRQCDRTVGYGGSPDGKFLLIFWFFKSGKCYVLRLYVIFLF